MITRWIISILLMIGLTFASFGHHTLAPDEQAQAEAYILAGGDWTDLCTDGTDPLGNAAKCMACVINHGCTLPPNGAMPTQAARSISVAWVISDQTTQSPRSAYAHAARAPPFI